METPKAASLNQFMVILTLLRCHPEPFACHSERSEESAFPAQGKLREGSAFLLTSDF